MNAKARLLLVVLVLTLLDGCLYLARYDGPYHGKVVDEETREPIEGVVVLGMWSVYHMDIGGGHHTYHDVREAVTDVGGEFTIKGQGLRIFSNLEPMDFLIYKSGYTYFGGSWDWFTASSRAKKIIKWEGDMPIIPLRKLTERERWSAMLPSEMASPERSPRMTGEINKERKFRGLD